MFTKKTILILIIFGLVGCIRNEKHELQNLIGLHLDSKFVQNYISFLNSEPKIYTIDHRICYSFYSDGLDFHFTKSYILEAIFFFSQKSKEHEEYTGSLPYGITFSNTLDDIEDILGPHEHDGIMGEHYYEA